MVFVKSLYYNYFMKCVSVLSYYFVYTEDFSMRHYV